MDNHPLSTNLVVSADGAATRSARAVVRDLCSHAALGTDTVQTAELLVTELVSNAIEHGGGSAVVDAVADCAGLRVSVVDTDPTLPGTPRLGSADDERGRGLLLVDALSSRWGAALLAPGKRVWFELDRAPAATA